MGLWEALGSGLAVALSVWLTTKVTPLFRFDRVTILSFWYLTYLAMIFLPAFVVYNNQEGPYRGRFLFSMHATLLTVPLGYWLACRYCKFRAAETECFFRSKVLPVVRTKRLRRIYLFVLIVSVVLAIFYIRSVDVIPLFYLLHNPGDYLQVALLREDSFKLLDSPLVYAFSVLRSVLFPFLAIVSLGYYLQERRKLWRNLFFGTLVGALFYCSLSAAKLPVAAVFSLIGFFLYYFHGGVVSRKTIAIFLGTVLAFPAAVTLTAYEGLTTWATALYSIVQRLCYLPSLVTYYYFEVFPHDHAFLLGRSVDKIARLMGWQPFPTALYVGAYAARPDDLSTVAFNAVFVSDFYADFGLPGVFLGGLVAGFVMACFHIFAVRRKRTVTTIALYAFLVFDFWLLNSSSLPVVLASNGALLVVILSWWFDRTENPVYHAARQKTLEPAGS